MSIPMVSLSIDLVVHWIEPLENPFLRTPFAFKAATLNTNEDSTVRRVDHLLRPIPYPCGFLIEKKMKYHKSIGSLTMSPPAFRAVPTAEDEATELVVDLSKVSLVALIFLVIKKSHLPFSRAHAAGATY